MLDKENKEISILKQYVEVFLNISATYALIFAKLGQISITERNIKLLRERLMQQYDAIQSKEKLLVLNIRAKYGNGKINTLTWTFKPE